MSDNNVIHVVFGPSGDYRIEHRSEPPKASPDPRPVESDDSNDPLSALYSRAEAARLFDIREGRLRYWERTEFIVPSAKRGRRRYYTFQDLIGVRAAKGLLDGGLPLQEQRCAASRVVARHFSSRSASTSTAKAYYVIRRAPSCEVELEE